MKIEVLDHGYVEFIEAWGHGKEGVDDTVRQDMGGDPYVHSDTDFEVGIIEAARQSTQKGFQGWEGAYCDSDCGKYNEMHEKVMHKKDCAYSKKPGDEKLLAYLYQHNHLTPFEFAGLVIEVQAPIFVFREWQRHRTQSYNEMSARYAPLPDLFYVPTLDRVMTPGNKQGGNEKQVNDLNAAQFIATLKEQYETFAYHYKLDIEGGVPKELARLSMPVGHYSRMRCSASLRNWLQFLSLRCDPAAQWEIRQFAWAVAKIIEEKFPRTWKLFQWDMSEKEGELA